MKETIEIWKRGAEDALDTAEKLFDNKKYHHALFFLHLALEKIFKAVYIVKKDKAPPYIHDLKYLAGKTGIKITEGQSKQLDEISEFNVSARYEDHKYKIYKKATSEYAQKWMEIGKTFYRKFSNIV